MRRQDYGDGDVCPLDESHGQMYANPTTRSQRCPHASHDGVWTRERKESATRSIWPLGVDSFRQAVAAATLPEIDISILGG